MMVPTHLRSSLSLLLVASATWLSACGSEEPSPPAGLKIHTFEVTPAHLEEPGDVTIRWVTSGAASLALFHGDQELRLGDRAIEEDSIAIRVSESTTFTLEASDAAGESVTASGTVEVVDTQRGPRIAQLLAPEVVEANEAGEASFTVRWTGVERATELRLLAPGRGPIELDPDAAEGSLDFSATEDTTFTLVARDGPAEFSLTATVRVVQLPAITRFEAERLLVGFTETNSVHWATTGAAYVELWQDGAQLHEVGATEGSHDLVFYIPSSLELRAFNELGTSATATLEVAVGTPRIVDLQLSSTSLWLDESVTFTWQTQGGSELTITLDESGETICRSSEYADIASSSCTWQPPSSGIYPLTLTLSNLSGTVTEQAEVLAGDGPKITHFDAAPKILTVGDELEVSWIVHGDPAGGEPRLSLKDDRSNDYDVGAEGPNGLLSTSLAEPGAYELQLEATTDNPRSSPDRATISLLVHPRPFVDLTATPAYFDELVEDEVVFSWTTRDAETVALYLLVNGVPKMLHEAAGADREAGSYGFAPREDGVYRLIATNTIGGAAFIDREVTVGATEILSFIADPPSFTQGQQIHLSWVVRRADELTLDTGTNTKNYLLEETDAPYLDLPDLGGTHLPLTGSCGAIDTLGCADLSFPGGFTFPFGTKSFGDVRIHTPGYLSFGTAGSPRDSVSENQTFPTHPQHAAISLAPFWDVLGWDQTRYSTGNIYTALLEEDGEPIFVIQWRDIGHFRSDWRAASFNFEVVLRQNGSFDFRYDTQSAGDTGIVASTLAGGSATIGFQLTDQTDAGVILFNGQPSINGSLAHRTFSYRPLANLPSVGELVFSPFARQSNLPITLTVASGEISRAHTLNLTASRKPFLELTPEVIAPVPIGEEFRLGWKSSNATTLVVIDEDGLTRCTAPNQSQIDEGVCGLSEQAEGLYRYTVRAIGDHDSIYEREISVNVFGAFAVVSFTADADTIMKGEDVLLSWEVFNAASVSLSADGIQLDSDPSGAPSGSFLAENIQQKTEFKLMVRNDVGATIEATLTVELSEVFIGLQSSATSVRPGDPVTITVEGYTLGTEADLQVYGLLPLAEIPLSDIPGSADRYVNIAGHPTAVNLGVMLFETSAATDVQLPADFAFPYMGEVYTRIRAFIDGYVSFNPSANTWPYNAELPLSTSQNGNVHLAPFWDDLTTHGAGYMHTARPSGDTFVIQWSNLNLYEGGDWASAHDLNFQIVLHRNGTFDFRYGTMAPHPTYRPPFGCYPNDCTNEVNGSAATIGYQGIGGTIGHTFHFGGAAPAASNLPVAGGLSWRTFRYHVIDRFGAFTFHPQKSETFSFCARAAGDPVCKELRIEVPFGITSASLSKDEIAFGDTVTLSWTSAGGRVLNIRDGATLVYTTSDPAEIDQGYALLEPAENTTYVVELVAGNRTATVSKLVEVARYSLTTAATASSGLGSAVTLSWNLTTADPGAVIQIIAPMEQISNADFSAYDISFAADVQQLIGPNVDSTNALLTFQDFSFPYFGVEHPSIRVATDGYLSWETGDSAGPNVRIPNALGTNAAKVMAPFWDDLHTRGNGRVLAKKIDDDRYVIQWTHMSLRYGGSETNAGNLSFLVVLHRNGTFEFRYGLMGPPLPGAASACFPAGCELETNGSSATIGYQIPGGVAGHLLHFGGTNLAMGQQPVAGGLSHRAWRFTPRTSAGPGSVQVHPADDSMYRICAYEPASTGLSCAPTLEVEVPWGIDLFQVNPAAPVAGQPVTLSWSVQGLDSLRILANENEIASHQVPSIPLLGTLSNTPSGITTYTLEGRSMGRVVREERLVVERAFDLSVTGPSGSSLPGENVVINWVLNRYLPGEVTMFNPMSEVPSGPGQEGAFVDISDIDGATQITMSGDTGSAVLTLPFTFPYLGTRQTSLHVFVDGYLSFAGVSGNGNGVNAVFPAATPIAAARVHIAPFWDDLILRGGDSIWRHAPDADTLIIQWTQVSRVQGSNANTRYNLNFQVVLRSNGSFEFRYGAMEPPAPPFTSTLCTPSTCLDEANGSSATIGYQSVDTRFGSNLHNATIAGASSSFPGGLSNRSFAYSPTLSGSARIVVGSYEDQQICGVLGDFVECKSVRINAVANPGDLMITEVMIDPATGAPGQWLELRNLTNRDIDLQGFELRSNQGSHRIAMPLAVPARAFITLASSAGVPFTPTYVYGGDVPLNHLIDNLELVAGSRTISKVSWAGDWSVPRGGVLSLDPSFHLTGVPENSSFARWCHSGSGGSPGTLGVGCLNPWYDTDPLSDRSFIDIATTGTRFPQVEANNQVARLPSTGFQAKLFGESYARLWVASNGWVSLSDTLPTSNPATINNRLPRTALEARNLVGPLVAPFWNLLVCGSDCRVFYERRQVAGDDVLIIQWEDFRPSAAASGSITFQLQLWADGDVVVAFDAVNHTHPQGSAPWALFQGTGGWTLLESRDPATYLNAHNRHPLDLEGRSLHFRSK